MTGTYHEFVVHAPYDRCARFVRPARRHAREGSGGANGGGWRRVFGRFAPGTNVAAPGSCIIPIAGSQRYAEFTPTQIRRSG
jgi:hypothetical protein